MFSIRYFEHLLVLLLLSTFLTNGYAHAAENTNDPITSVGGLISQNTTWTSELSPYLLVDDVVVSEDVILTIEPGTMIELSRWSLTIEGTLSARGDENNMIRFHSIEPPVLSQSRIFFAETSTPWDELSNGGCIIEYSEISCSNYQYETIMGGSPKIANNLILNYGNNVAAIQTGDGYLIANNTIVGGHRGITAFNGTIVNNIVTDTLFGISCSFTSPKVCFPIIIGNSISNNGVGIEIWQSSPYIANNTITGNSRGILYTEHAFSQGAAPVEVLFNNIYGNGYNVFVEYEDPQITINMTRNWWDTTNTLSIDEGIYDHHDQSTLSLVNYEPLLHAPAIIQEFHTLFLLSILMVTILVVLFVHPQFKRDT